MAVNYTDFEKIWASTSPLTPYSFSDANYKRGWDFVGSTPPSRQMWDAFMQHADEKLQYLYLHEDVPVGHEYFTFNPNVPQGSLPLFGGEYSRETYSALWAWVQQQTGYLKTDAEWQALAASNNGNVPYYSDGDGSTTFRVPALKCYIKAADGTFNEVGSYYAAGLPNITGQYSLAYDMPSLYNNNAKVQGAFYKNNTLSSNVNRIDYASGGNGIDIAFDASLSNSIYGNSNTVTPETVVGMWLVKAYGVIRDTGTINEQQYIDDRLATKLSVNGGTMYAPISFNTTGQIGYRGTAHVDNTTILRQLIVSSGDIDNWNDGNAKIALHTYSADNSSEDGSFNLLATDGTNNATLQGKPNGDLLWANKKVITQNNERLTLQYVSNSVITSTQFNRNYAWISNGFLFLFINMDTTNGATTSDITTIGKILGVNIIVDTIDNVVEQNATHKVGLICLYNNGSNVDIKIYCQNGAGGGRIGRTLTIPLQ